MELRDLEYAAATASTGNLSRAARLLGLNTATISRHISRLEDELGLALFERGHAGVRLTAGGKAVMRHVRRALADLEAVRHSGSQNGSGALGEIRLGVRLSPVGEGFVTLLAGWRKRHPNVTLTLAEMNDRELATALEERRLDVVLTPNHAIWPHAASLPLYRERLVAAVPAGHPLAERPAVSWDELHGEVILIEGRDDGQTNRALFASFLGDSAKFQPHPAGKQCLLALVAAGFGVTVATASQSAVPFPGVAFRPIDDPGTSFQMALAWLPELEDAAVGRFVAFLRDEARSRGLL